MRIGVRYMAQLKLAAGVAVEHFALDPPATVADLLAHVAARHDEPLRRLLLDANGQIQPTILAFVGDSQADLRQTVLRDGDLVTLLSPIAGG